MLMGGATLKYLVGLALIGEGVGALRPGLEIRAG